MDRLDTLPVGESGRLLFEIARSDEATQATAAELSKVVQGKSILGLVAQAPRSFPSRPRGRRLPAG